MSRREILIRIPFHLERSSLNNTPILPEKEVRACIIESAKRRSRSAGILSPS
jgi:hypothetical protein